MRSLLELHITIWTNVRYVGEKIWLLASGGQEGVAALGDEVPAGCSAGHVVSSAASTLHAFIAPPM